jgi:hypothetical protein
MQVRMENATSTYSMQKPAYMDDLVTVDTAMQKAKNFVLTCLPMYLVLTADVIDHIS